MPAAPHQAAPPSRASPATPRGAVSRVQARFNAFIRTFKEAGTDEEPKYMQLLLEVRYLGAWGDSSGVHTCSAWWLHECRADCPAVLAPGP